MNLWLLLRLPWLAATRSARGLALFVIGASLCGALLLGLAIQLPDGSLPGVIMLGFGVGLLWLYFLPNMLALVIHADRLRVPGIDRAVAWSLWLYAVLTIGIPMLVSAWVGADAATTAALLALIAAGCLVLALSPSYLMLLPCAVPVWRGIGRWLDLPGPYTPGFVVWAGALAAGLTVLAIVRWRRVLRYTDPLAPGLRAPLIFRLNQNVMAALAAGDTATAPDPDSLQMLRRRPDWLQRQPDLRGCGPARPVRALRVALGGLLLPQTPRGRLQQLLPMALMVVMLALVMLVGDGTPELHMLSELWRFGGPAFAIWFIALCGMMVTLMVAGHLQLGWRKVNAELPLLALLPGLGDAGQAKRELLRATLAVPLYMQAGLLAVLWLAAMALHLSAGAIAFIAITQLGCAGLLVALVLGVIGGRPVAGATLAILVAVAFVLISLSIFLPMAALGGLWIAFGLALAGIGRRGWHGLRLRAHAFVPND